MKAIYRNVSFSLIMLLLAFFLLGAGLKPMKQVDYWKKKVLDAHGGAEKITGVSTLVFSGKIVTRGDSGTVKLTLARPGKLRATLKYTKRCEDRILLENKGLRDFGNGFQEAAGHSLDAMIFQYNHLNLPMGLLDKKFEMSYGEVSAGEQNLPVLNFLAMEEPPMAAVIDPKTGLIKQVVGKIRMGKNVVQMGVGYGDYRMVDGIMLPHQIINYVNGVAIAESRFDTVLVNSRLAPETFDISTSNCKMAASGDQ